MGLSRHNYRLSAKSGGFELIGVAPAVPLEREVEFYHSWAGRGFAGTMGYLTDRRGSVRDDPRNLLPSARSMVCVGKLYNGPQPYSTRFSGPELAWISRYAWGEDYHQILRAGLERLAICLREAAGCDFESRVCVDTAPLLERSYARRAGLGWIGRNTCLINQAMGSWFFLGELLVSLDLAPGEPPPDRCGTCTRCVDACPTAAITPDGLDARRCISYLTIELRGAMDPTLRSGVGRHVFGCDICQDVCPWNRRAPVAAEARFAPGDLAPPLEKLAALSEAEFREIYRASPVKRARYTGFLRNVAVAMGNAGLPQYREPLARLAGSEDAVVAEHARWALAKIEM